MLGIEPGPKRGRGGQRARRAHPGRVLQRATWPTSWRRAAGRADVVHANNVIAHVPDLNGFVAGIARILKPDGVAVVEMPYLRELVERTRVRHDLPRARVLLLAHRAGRACSRATAWWSPTSSAIAGPRRVRCGCSCATRRARRGAHAGPPPPRRRAPARASARPDYYAAFAGRVSPRRGATTMLSGACTVAGPHRGRVRRRGQGRASCSTSSVSAPT